MTSLYNKYILHIVKYTLFSFKKFNCFLIKTILKQILLILFKVLKIWIEKIKLNSLNKVSMKQYKYFWSPPPPPSMHISMYIYTPVYWHSPFVWHLCIVSDPRIYEQCSSRRLENQPSLPAPGRRYHELRWCNPVMNTKFISNLY